MHLWEAGGTRELFCSRPICRLCSTKRQEFPTRRRVGSAHRMVEEGQLLGWGYVGRTCLPYRLTGNHVIMRFSSVKAIKF